MGSHHDYDTRWRTLEIRFGEYEVVLEAIVNVSLDVVRGTNVLRKKD